MVPAAYFLGLGFLLGLKHALDADHLAAVAALTAEEKDWRRSFLLGIRWGLGHGLVLLLAGCAALLLRWPIPPGLAPWAEAAVGAMLVVLGGRVLWRVAREGAHIHPHRHGDFCHIHFHSHRPPGRREIAYSSEPPVREGGSTERGDYPGAGWPPGHEHLHGFRPLLVGMVHGVAGSAGLTLLVAATAPSAGEGLVFLAALGLGAALAMGALSASLRLPLTWARGRSQRWERALREAMGLMTLLLGFSLLLSRGGGGGG